MFVEETDHQRVVCAGGHVLHGRALYAHERAHEGSVAAQAKLATAIVAADPDLAATTAQHGVVEAATQRANN